MFNLRGQLFVQILRAKRLQGVKSEGKRSKKPDSYVRISIRECILAETKIARKTRDPRWDEFYLLDVCHQGDTLDLQVLGDTETEDVDLGLLEIPLERLLDGKEVAGEYHLMIGGEKNPGRIFFKIMLFVMEDLDKASLVQNCYFEQQSNCKVTLMENDTNLFKTLEEATKFIYVSGLCVSSAQTPPQILSDLLISKAEKGVTVLVFVHNEDDVDKESLNKVFLSKVHCMTDKNSRSDQVTVTCDAPGSYVKRRVVCFFGQSHRGNIRMQAKIEGMTALDVKLHFEERWRKDCSHLVGEIYRLNGTEFDLTHKYHGPDQWQCQLFRRVSDSSALFTDPSKKQILTREKNDLCENTLHKACIHHIRRSKRFIYMETQCLIGVGHMEDKDSTSCSNKNLIPVEIAMRIVEAIHQGEDFLVYVVSPLKSVTQDEESDNTRIRDHLKTVRMMYGLIKEALTQTESEKLPSDYLAFLCVDRGSKGSYHDCAVFDDQYVLLGTSGMSSVYPDSTELGLGFCQTNLEHQKASTFRKSLLSSCIKQAVEQWENEPHLPSTLHALKEEALQNWNQNDSETLPENVLLSPYQVDNDRFISLCTYDEGNGVIDCANGDILNSDDDDQLTDAEVQPVDTVTQPADHEVRPVDTEVQPVYTEVHRAVSEVQPLDTDVPSDETEVKPVHTEVMQAGSEIQPVHTEVQPVHTEIQPVDTEVIPIDTDDQPVYANLASVDAGKPEDTDIERQD